MCSKLRLGRIKLRECKKHIIYEKQELWDMQSSGRSKVIVMPDSRKFEMLMINIETIIVYKKN